MKKILKTIKPKITLMQKINFGKGKVVWLSFPRNDKNPYTPEEIREIGTRALKNFKGSNLSCIVVVFPTTKSARPISTQQFQIDSIDGKIPSPRERDSDNQLWETAFSFALAVFGDALKNIEIKPNSDDSDDSDDYEDEVVEEPNKFWSKVNERKTKK